MGRSRNSGTERIRIFIGIATALWLIAAVAAVIDRDTLMAVSWSCLAVFGGLVSSGAAHRSRGDRLPCNRPGGCRRGHLHWHLPARLVPVVARSRIQHDGGPGDRPPDLRSLSVYASGSLCPRRRGLWPSPPRDDRCQHHGGPGVSRRQPGCPRCQHHRGPGRTREPALCSRFQRRRERPQYPLLPPEPFLSSRPRRSRRGRPTPPAP